MPTTITLWELIYITISNWRDARQRRRQSVRQSTALDKRSKH